MVRPVLLLWLAGCGGTAGDGAAATSRGRAENTLGRAPLPDLVPVSTFSIVGLDPETGEIGVAVQSKFVAVGAVVPVAKAGVGAVATQAWANTGYGPRALDLMAEGKSPAEALAEVTAVDPHRARRQVGLLDARGRAATFTGNRCFAWAGGRVGENFVCQGNILAGEAVVDAMAEAFRASEGELGDRLIAALQAGQEAGGDVRGQQSAALLVVREGWGYGGQSDRYRDLRVDDHPSPIAELKRLHDVHRGIFPRPK